MTCTCPRFRHCDVVCAHCAIRQSMNMAGVEVLFITDVVEGVLLGGVCVLGLLGNTLALLVLWRVSRKQPTVIFLMALSLSDWLLLLYLLLTKALAALASLGGHHRWSQVLRDHDQRHLWAVGCVFQVWSVWITVLVTLDRWMVVCRPFLARRVSTRKWAIWSVVLTFLGAVVFSTPRLFHMTVLTGVTPVATPAAPPDTLTDILDSYLSRNGGNMGDVLNLDDLRTEDSLYSESWPAMDYYNEDLYEDEMLGRHGLNSKSDWTRRLTAGRDASGDDDDTFGKYDTWGGLDFGVPGSDVDFFTDLGLEDDIKHHHKLMKNKVRKINSGEGADVDVSTGRTHYVGDDVWYKYLYYMGATWVVVYVGPIVTLLVFNILLTKALHQAKRDHAMLTGRTPTTIKASHNVTVNVIAIVTVFLWCQTPDFVITLIQAWPHAPSDSSDVLTYLSAVSYLLLAVNSSVNVVIYTLFYRKFRYEIRAMMRCQTTTALPCSPAGQIEMKKS